MKRDHLSTILGVLLLSGCGYTIEGRVMRGSTASVDWIESGASMPDGEPVTGASVLLLRDAESMHPEPAGSATSGANGTFALSVSGFGAGWMQESWLVRAAGGGAGRAEWIGELPSSPLGRLLVIVLGPDDGNFGNGGGIGSLWRGNVGHREDGASLLDEVRQYK